MARCAFVRSVPTSVIPFTARDCAHSTASYITQPTGRPGLVFPHCYEATRDLETVPSSPPHRPQRIVFWQWGSGVLPTNQQSLNGLRRIEHLLPVARC